MGNAKQKLTIILLFLLLLIVIPVFLYFISKSQNITDKRITSPIVNFVETISRSKLKHIVESNFSKEKGEWAVVVKNLKTGESFKYNGNQKFDSASLYKLWVMAVAKGQIEDGNLNEGTLLSAEKEKLDETLSTVTPTPTPLDFIPTPTPEEFKKEIISMTVSDALEKMITISDNYSALLLSARVGPSNITSFLKDYGFDNSNYASPPETSASDIAEFFELLYKGEIVSEKTSIEMIEILKQQTFDDRIPKYLPKNTEVAHKTGELFGAKHDAGIVFSKGGDYIIVVLSKTENEKEAAEKIARFSEEIYKYFNN